MPFYKVYDNESQVYNEIKEHEEKKNQVQNNWGHEIYDQH